MDAPMTRYTVCIWKTTPEREESVLWYSGPMRVALESSCARLVITVERVGPDQERGEGVSPRG